MDWRELGAVKRELAAKILGGLSIKTVDDLIHSGHLRSCPAGRRVLVTVHSLRCYLGEIAGRPTPISEPEAVASAPQAPPRPPLSPGERRILAEARRRVG
jgi:hypothetical protein